VKGEGQSDKRSRSGHTRAGGKTEGRRKTRDLPGRKKKPTLGASGFRERGEKVKKKKQVKQPKGSWGVKQSQYKWGLREIANAGKKENYKKIPNHLGIPVQTDRGGKEPENEKKSGEHRLSKNRPAHVSVSERRGKVK